MMPTHIRAIAEERGRRRLSPELERYLRWEYGPGTGAAYFLAELEHAANRRHEARPHRPSIIARIERAIASLVARARSRRRGGVDPRPQPRA